MGCLAAFAFTSHLGHGSQKEDAVPFPFSGVVKFPPVPSVKGLFTEGVFAEGLFRLVGRNIRVNQDETTEPQNQPVIAVSPLNSDILVAGANDYQSGDTRCGFYFSSDGGQTWRDGILPGSYDASGDGDIAVDGRGNFYYSYSSFERADIPGALSVITVAKTTNDGRKWKDPVTVASGTLQTYEDKAMIAADATKGRFANNIYVSWTHGVDVNNDQWFEIPPDEAQIQFARSTQ